MLSVVVDEQARAELATDLDELFREGARRMLAAALEAEVEAYIAAHTELLDEHGHRLGGRKGHAPARTLAPRGGPGRGGPPAGGRPSHRLRHRRAGAVPERDPAPLVSAQPEGGRGAAAAVPAWAVEPGLRARAGAVLRRRGWPVRVGGDPADRPVAGQAGGVPAAGSGRPGLCVLLG